MYLLRPSSHTTWYARFWSLARPPGKDSTGTSSLERPGSCRQIMSAPTPFQLLLSSWFSKLRTFSVHSGIESPLNGDQKPFAKLCHAVSTSTVCNSDSSILSGILFSTARCSERLAVQGEGRGGWKGWGAGRKGEQMNGADAFLACLSQRCTKVQCCRTLS